MAFVPNKDNMSEVAEALGLDVMTLNSLSIHYRAGQVVTAEAVIYVDSEVDIGARTSKQLRKAKWTLTQEEDLSE